MWDGARSHDRQIGRSKQARGLVRVTGPRFLLRLAGCCPFRTGKNIERKVRELAGAEPFDGDSTHHGVVHIETNQLSTCAVFRQLKEADLLREELSIAGADTIFQKVLATL